VVVGRDLDQLASRQHHLGPDDVVPAHAVRPRQPTEPADQGAAHHADVVVGGGDGDQPGPGPIGDGLHGRPAGASADGRGARAFVEADDIEAGDVDEEGVVSAHAGPARVPVAWTTSSSWWRSAWSTAAATSAASRATTMAAGRWTTRRSHPDRRVS
jgi:hypothetical protein